IKSERIVERVVFTKSKVKDSVHCKTAHRPIQKAQNRTRYHGIQRNADPLGKLYGKRQNHFESEINKSAKRLHRICNHSRTLPFNASLPYPKIYRTANQRNAELGKTEIEIRKTVGVKKPKFSPCERLKCPSPKPATTKQCPLIIIRHSKP